MTSDERFRRPPPLLIGVIVLLALAALQAWMLAAPVELTHESLQGYRIERVGPSDYELTLLYDSEQTRPPSITLLGVGDARARGEPPHSSRLLPLLGTAIARQYVMQLRVPPGTYRLQVDGGPPFGLLQSA